MQTGSPLIQRFYPSLDGVRAIAFLMVFCYHFNLFPSGAPVFKWGWVGVDLFFVLSGFLITGILFDSLHRQHYFRNFYLRRALRVFPLFYGFWIVLLLLSPLIHIHWNRYNLASVLYLGNIFLPGAAVNLHPNPFTATYFAPWPLGTGYLNVGALWSLCVEEQFYLLWPAVVWLVRSRVALLRVCLGVIVLVPLCRCAFLFFHPGSADPHVLYFSFWSRADCLLCGAALALWLRGNPPTVSDLRRRAMWVIILAPCLLAVLMHRFAPSAAEPRLAAPVSTIGFSLIAFTCTGILVLSLDPATLLHRLLQKQPLVYLGRISYGLYFYHSMPQGHFVGLQTVLGSYRHLGFLYPLFLLLFSVTAASLSFRYWESPFLRLKSKWAPRPGAAEDPPPFPFSSSVFPESPSDSQEPHRRLP